MLGAYRYTELKSDPEPSRIESLPVVGKGGKRVQAALERGRAVAEAVCLARDLVNQPGGTLTPTAFADAGRGAGRAGGLRASRCSTGRRSRTRGWAACWASTGGPTEEPRFVKLAWEPDRSPRATVALVGKGITFDSGGLSLKTTDGDDRHEGRHGRRRRGAGAVLGARRGAARRCGCSASCRSTDNMPGGDATRVGDVLRIRNGKTVEVLNTDAEGRLVLADALSLASEAEPDAIVDLATLTGACMVALGTRHRRAHGQPRRASSTRCAPRPTPRASRCGRCRCPTTCAASSTPTSPTSRTWPAAAGAAR